MSASNPTTQSGMMMDSPMFESDSAIGRAVNGAYNTSYSSANGRPSYNDDEFASKTYANIIRDEYADYMSRFQPYENKVLDLAESRELLNQQLGRITTNVNRSFSNPNMNAGALMQQRFGTSQNQQEQSSQFRNNNRNQALSVAHAKNNTRLADADRRTGLITGSNNSRQNLMRATQEG